MANTWMGDAMSDECPHMFFTEHRNGNHVILVCNSCGAWLRSYYEG